jgi:aryl-alcohol dehydrogenase-like predicted oxidoreductase
VKKRRLGTNGPLVSSIGLGCHAIAGGYGTADENEAIALLSRALDEGVDLLDTSDNYGAGRSEEIIGQSLRGRREKATIITKFGNPGRDDNNNPIGKCGRPEYVSVACDRSLKRLGVDVIDIYMLHRIDPSVPIEDTIGAMGDLVRRGKVRFIGLSEARPETIRRAHKTYPLAAVESEYSLWSRDIESDVLPVCRDLGIGFVAYAPVGRGFLAGAVTEQTVFGPKDSRLEMPRFQRDALSQNILALNAFKAYASSMKATPSQLALAWLLGRGEDIVPIVGTRRLAHLQENALATELKLTPESQQTIEKIISKTTIVGNRYSDDYMKVISY